MKNTTITLADILKSDRNLLDQIKPQEKTRFSQRKIDSLYAILDEHIPFDTEMRNLINEQIALDKWTTELQETFAKNIANRKLKESPNPTGDGRLPTKLYELDEATQKVLYAKLVQNGFIYNKESPTGLSCKGQVRNLSGDNKLIPYFTCPRIGNVRYIVRLKEILYFLGSQGKIMDESQVSTLVFHPYTKELNTRKRGRSLESVKNIVVNGVA